MFHHNPHTAIRNHGFHLREHLTCAGILSIAVILLSLMAAFIFSNHYKSRSAVYSAIMDFTGRAAVISFLAVCLFRIAIDLFNALSIRREIQSHYWASLSITRHWQ
jgi:uncharacterized PurR-regulated membrane protein YhhQ (DUF165 family)